MGIVILIIQILVGIAGLNPFETAEKKFLFKVFYHFNCLLIEGSFFCTC